MARVLVLFAEASIRASVSRVTSWEEQEKMSVQIRLARHGSKKTPFYRIVVTDTRSPRDGRFLENLGTFNPNVEPPVVELKQDRLSFWQERGAKTSPTLTKVIKLKQSQSAS